VVLVPFLLSTAVFSRLAVLDLTLPAQSSGVEKLKGDDLKLEVVIRPDGLNVGDRIGGQIMWIANTTSGYDYHTLSQLMLELKARFPDKTEASVLAEPGHAVRLLVGVMDAVREGHLAQGANVVKETFSRTSRSATRRSALRRLDHESDSAAERAERKTRNVSQLDMNLSR